MKTSIAVAFGAILLSSAAHASPQCTAAPETDWISIEAMKRRIEQDGYTIVVFKTTGGRCYEIYGRDKNDRRVEIYFDPVSGAAVQSTVR